MQRNERKQSCFTALRQCHFNSFATRIFFARLLCPICLRNMYDFLLALLLRMLFKLFFLLSKLFFSPPPLSSFTEQSTNIFTRFALYLQATVLTHQSQLWSCTQQQFLHYIPAFFFFSIYILKHRMSGLIQG